MKTPLFVKLPVIPVLALSAASLHAQVAKVEDLGQQVVLQPTMVIQSPAEVVFDEMLDEQQTGSNPLLNAATSMWAPKVKKEMYPLEFVIDLGEKRHLSTVLIWDSNGTDNVSFFHGGPDTWSPLFVEDGKGINRWKFHQDLNIETRYLRIVKDRGATFGELLVYEYRPEQKAAALAQQEEKARKAALEAKAQADAANRPLVESGTLFGKLPLVDELDMGNLPADRGFLENPTGISKVETVLGRTVRTIPNTMTEPGFFAYKVAEGKLLKPGAAYLLTVEFPEDVTRTFTISNRGADMMRGIQTGQSLGDSIFGYTATNMESLNVPLSGKYQTFQQLFWLGETIADIAHPRGENAKRHPVDASGFWVLVNQWEKKQMPVGEGAAISRIRLFEVPQPEKYNVALKLPPAPLPQRHLFYREEMADGSISSTDPKQRSYSKHEDWFENHFRNLNFLGMNTFAKDLLEFGAPQHWDVLNGGWYHQSKAPKVWENIVPMASKYGLSILPYYEYAGSSGPMGLAQKGKETAQPLNGPGDYTHIKWAETKRVDITDPEVLAEFLHIIDLTVVKYKDQAQFAGVWLRPRVSQMPISFADPVRARFAKETNQAGEVTREELKANEQLREAYYDWWFKKRRDFLVAISKHLKEKEVGGNPVVLFMPTSGEPTLTVSLEGKKGTPLVTDSPELWEEAFAAMPDEFGKHYVTTLEEALSGRGYQRALENPVKDWSSWEWTHATPKGDYANYKDVPGVLMTYPFNRLYTVNDPGAIENFRGPSGLAMIRHYPLNENSMGKNVGYFVTDVDRPGPYGVMPEAMAVANGDPWYLGYTSGHIYNRPFPDAVRRFNANFLALPALPSQRLEGAASDKQVVVRGIDAGAHGKYVAVVNVGMEPKTAVKVKLPAGKATEVVSGREIGTGEVALELEPFELRTILVK